MQIRNVKIVATIGPASESKENLKQLIIAGMNVARLNFSHGSHEQHLKVIQNIRELCSELNTHVSILQDLQGPKVRVGKFEDGFIEIKPGETVVITTRDILGKPGLLPTDVKSLARDVEVGSRILLDDGILELKVQSTDGVSEISCEVIYGGILKDRKGMNVPGGNLSMDCMTDKDFKDLYFGIENRVDYVALSFVRRGEDIEKLQVLLKEKHSNAKIIAKIEMLEAIENLQEIIRKSDAIMVARGDLAIETGQSLLPGLQKRIIKESNNWKKPVITATQMLDSMVNNPLPTRAEITDVANAILDGTDAIMLSAETASGKYPAKCIRTMHDIAIEVEKDITNYYKFTNSKKKWTQISEAIAESACLTARSLNASFIICLSTSGKTATLISSFRPKSPVLSVTHVAEGLNSLELVWGVQTLRAPAYESAEQALQYVEKFLLKFKLVKPGDRLILTLGLPVVERPKTNALRVHIVRDVDTENWDGIEKKPLRFL